MNISTVNSIYHTVGETRCKSLLSEKAKAPAKVFITEASINVILKLIRCHVKITRKSMIVKAGFSRTTAELAIRALTKRGLIVKEYNMKVMGQPVTYSLAK